MASYRIGPGSDRLHQRVLVREHLEAHTVGMQMARQVCAMLGHEIAHHRAEERAIETEVDFGNSANGRKAQIVRSIVATQRANVA